MREPLPSRRFSETFKLRHGGQDAAYHVTVGRYADGRRGEIFISTNQVGTQIEALAHDLAVLASIALQHGARIEEIASALTREADSVPSTIIGAVFDRLVQKTE